MISDLTEKKEYAPKELEHLHNILLMILKDFIDFCDEHDITYFIDGGSTLGCVRHQGFIPWDDDIDVILFRDQYDKFLKYRHEFDDKYEILNMEDYDDYCRLFSKISLKGTRQGEYCDRNSDYTFGINIDVFAFDNIPNSRINQKLFSFHFKMFRKLVQVYEMINSDVYVSKTKERIGHIIRFLFKTFRIDSKFVKKQGRKLIEKSKKLDSNYVSSFGTPYDLYAFDKSIFDHSIKAKFESLEVNLAHDYEKYLRINYGDDYMELPPVEKRINHKHNGLDFGKY